MRTLKLTHKDIELLNNALHHYYNHNVKAIDSVSKDLLKDSTIKKIYEEANKYIILAEKISDGTLDV